MGQHFFKAAEVLVIRLISGLQVITCDLQILQVQSILHDVT